MSESTADRNPVELLAEEFAARLRRGEHPSLTEYVERYPELAEDIRDLFPALALVEQFKPERKELDGALAASLPAARNELPAQLGDYRILRYLGEGGMGVVYEAIRESLRSHVALKVMHPQYRGRPNYLRRFHTEARSAARLHHTNIVSVFDYGEHDGVCYYAMQYIAGQSLDRVLDDIRQLRREKGRQSTGETATLPVHAGSQAEQDEVAERPEVRCVPNALKETVTMGLLTGKFPTASADESSRELEMLAPSEVGATPVAEEANVGAATRLFVSEIRRAEAGIRPPSQKTPTSAVTEPSKVSFPVDNTSTLTGKSDIRYYREVARLGAQVADALAYAHERRVLHRDIKPSNLILDAPGNIWVTDFGLAKFEEGDDVSKSQDTVGTLRYMAPERFQGVSDRLGDVYALGATLYELLTLRYAFGGKDQLDLIRRIEAGAPVPPRELDPKIPSDLETIVLKALAKEPGDRFASAEEMAADLRLFVDNRPIRSRPIPYHEQFWRWCKRNPGLATANITAAALTTVLAIVSTVAALIYYDRNERALRDNVRILRAENETSQQLFHALTARARAGRFSRQKGQRFDSLEALRQAAAIGRELKLPPQEFVPLRDEAIACLALPDLKETGRTVPRPTAGGGAAFDSTMARYALRSPDGMIQVRRVTDDQKINSFQARGDRDIRVFALSSDGRYLATTHQPGDTLMVWDVDRGAAVLDEACVVAGWAARFSPDSRRIAVGQRNGDVFVYDLVTHKTQNRWPGAGYARDLSFRADGDQIAVLHNGESPVCTILDAETGRAVRTIPLPPNIESVAWSADGSTLATPSVDSKIYVWDAATGTRKTLLEGCTNSGLHAAFHPAGTLLASNGYEARLRFWDPVLGRSWFSLGVPYDPYFSQDGRIAVSIDDKLTICQVDPAVEYRILAHASTSPPGYQEPSVRGDGRVLAVGTNTGAVLWDLARGTELAFLPIGKAWRVMFEPSGNLLTSGSAGVVRWPVRLDQERREFRIGPPRKLPLPASNGQLDEDRTGRTIALANGTNVCVATTGGMFGVGPLDDCRGVSLSPDGQWLATGSHARGARVWKVRDRSPVTDLPVDGGTSVRFSPDGKWLMTSDPCRLWPVGTWRDPRQLVGSGRCFSADGGLLVVQDTSMIIRLVETETGRTVARLESPDLCHVAEAAFTPDGSRLVITTNDGSSARVWDLRAIRRHLAAMGLDWDAPAYSDDDPASPALPPLPTIEVDLGSLGGQIEHFTERPETLVKRYTAQITKDPNDSEAYHHRGHAQHQLQHPREAIDDFTQAIRLRPDDAHLRAVRGAVYEQQKQWETAIVDLEAAMARTPDDPSVKESLAMCCNNRAWELATGPAAAREIDRALRLARRALELEPSKGIFLNTFGVAQYRAGRYEDAIATLEQSRTATRGEFEGFDSFFLAMAHMRLGHHAEARRCYERALGWLPVQNRLSENDAKELAAFRGEAEAVLARRSDALPAYVFPSP